MNKELMRSMGFDKEMDNVENSKCPSCDKIIDPITEFKDEISLRDFKITGFCQKCQDKLYA